MNIRKRINVHKVIAIYSKFLPKIEFYQIYSQIQHKMMLKTIKKRKEFQRRQGKILKKILKQVDKILRDLKNKCWKK